MTKAPRPRRLRQAITEPPDQVWRPERLPAVSLEGLMASDELDEGWKPADLVLVLGSQYCCGLDLGLLGR